MTAWNQEFITVASLISATVLNALWQDALLVTGVWLLLRAWPKINAATRYFVWSATLAAAFIVPVSTTLAFFAPAHHVWSPVLSESVQRRLPSVTGAPAREIRQTRSIASPPVSRVPQRMRFTLPGWAAVTVFALWLLLAGYALVRLAIGLVRLEQLKRDALPLPVAYRDAMPQWLRANKGARDVRLCVSDETDVPVAVGLFDAMILIPRSLLERLDEPEVDQICLHELAHLRRADDWTNGIQRVVSALLGWNPALQFLGQQLDLEREVACDDWVLSFIGAVRPYALCLTKMAESALWPRHPIPAPGVFATRKHISLRIERLLGGGRNIATSFSVAPAAAAIATVAATALVIAVVAPSVAASSVASPAAPSAAVARETSTPPRAPSAESNVRSTVKIIRVTTFVTAAPVQSTVSQAPGIQKLHATVAQVTPTPVGAPSVFDAQALAEKIEHRVNASLGGVPLGTLVAQANACVHCDYSGVNWAGRDLHGVNFTGVDLSRANLPGVNFSGGSFNGVDFSAANLTGASFRNAHLTGCDFSKANLGGADFTNAWMSGCDFTAARLTAAQLRDVLGGCKGCDFSRADLAGLDLHGVRTNGDDFSGADLRNVNFAGAQLVGTDFSNAKLDGANLSGTTLTGCDLSGVDLSRVDLSKAKLVGTDLRNR